MKRPPLALFAVLALFAAMEGFKEIKAAINIAITIIVTIFPNVFPINN
jgi:hypothetical protein